MNAGAYRDAPSGAAQAYLLLVFATFCWGANAVLGRLAVGEISPMALVTVRWLGTSLLAAVFFRHQILRDWPVLRRYLLPIAATGVVGFTLFNSLYYVAAHFTTALNIGIVQGAIPVFVVIGAFLVYRMRVTPLQLVGVALTIGGVVVVGSGGEFSRLAALALNFGDLLMIVVCVIHAGYTLALRRQPAVSMRALFAVMAVSAFLASLPALAVEAAVERFQWPTAAGWVVVALVTLFPSFLAQIAYILGVRSIGPSRAGVFMNLVPVFASILAVIILREPFEAFHAAALAMVLVGIALSERGKAR